MYDDIISIKAFKSESEIKASKDEVLFVTQNGLAKRIKVKDLTTVRKTVKCISIKDGDRLQVVNIIKEPTDLLIYSSDGYGVRVRSEDVREASKTAMGSIVYRLKDNSKVIGCEEISPKDKGMMIITSKGNAKLCELTNFPLSENGNPLILIKLNKAECIEVIKCVKGKEQFSLFMRSGVFNIAVEDLGKPMPRLAKGVKTVPIRKGDKIVKIM
jgi:DNA gyrase/topoisomerase IV subunit A